ncbi:hypothetical protein [Niabella terrae]
MKRKPGNTAFGQQWGRALERAGVWLESQQRKLAQVLNRKCADLSANQLLAGFICFSLFTALIFSYIIWVALTRSTAMKLPEKITSSPYRKQETYPDNQKDINQIMVRLDSLRNTPNADSLFNRIQLYRPGLLDSIAFIDSIYRTN